MTVIEIQDFLQPQMEQVEAFIRIALRSDIQLLDSLNRSLREHPGKMLRPSMALLVAGAVGEATPPPEDTYRYAATAELLHNATLLHDDVVDGATERRGMPTIAALMGGSAAVLVGDYWLGQCLKLVLGGRRDTYRVLRLFAQTISHLTEGEMLQMQKAASADTTQEDYLRIIYNKTASLFESTAMSAALSVGATEEEVHAMGDFAVELGMAFQIKDDIFDYTDAADALGKPVGIDLLEQKITQPLLCALETVPEAEQQRIRGLVRGIADDPSLAAEISAFVKAHDGQTLAVAQMEKHIDLAIGYLSILPPSREKEALCDLVRYVGQREK